MCIKKPKQPKPQEQSAPPPDALLASEVLAGRIRARQRLGFRGSISQANPRPGILGAEPGGPRGARPQATLLGS